jgi:excisionase family DNA binding protein
MSSTHSAITSGPLRPESFVSADEAAKFLSVKRRYLLELARRGISGAYPLGTGNKRKIWVFRLSELAASVARNETRSSNPPKPCTIGSGSPR